MHRPADAWVCEAARFGILLRHGWGCRFNEALQLRCLNFMVRAPCADRDKPSKSGVGTFYFQFQYGRTRGLNRQRTAAQAGGAHKNGWAARALGTCQAEKTAATALPRQPCWRGLIASLRAIAERAQT